MSPRMSKTMVRPSGDTSQLIQVPSSVSNSTLVTGPCPPSTSHGSGFFEASCNCSIFFCASCSCLSLSCWFCARAGANEERATQRVRRSAGNLLDTVSPQEGGRERRKSDAECQEERWESSGHSFTSRGRIRIYFKSLERTAGLAFAGVVAERGRRGQRNTKARGQNARAPL